MNATERLHSLDNYKLLKELESKVLIKDVGFHDNNSWKTMKGLKDYFKNRYLNMDAEYAAYYSLSGIVEQFCDNLDNDDYPAVVKLRKDTEKYNQLTEINFKSSIEPYLAWAVKQKSLFLFPNP